MSVTDQDILSYVRADDDTATQKLGELQTEELVKIRESLTKPIRLSYPQRMMARAFGISVDAEQKRFDRLVGQILANRASPQ